MNRSLSLWHLVGCLIIASTLTQCASSPKVAGEAGGRVKGPPSFWAGDGMSGARKIVIDLSKQRLRYYKGGELVGGCPIASGRSDYPTPTGSYRVIEKDIDHRSSLYGAYIAPDGFVVMSDVDTRKDKRPAGSEYVGASMNYFMRITGGIGLHEGPIPGYPASHGCIRLPSDMARILFNETPHGTPVIVTGNASLAPYSDAIAVGQSTLTTSSVSKPEKNQANESQGAPSRSQSERNGWFRREPAGPPPGTTLYLY